MKLPVPPDRYDSRDQAQLRRTLELEDMKCAKAGRDIEMGQGRLILMAPNGSRWALAVSNLGVLSAVSVP